MLWRICKGILIGVSLIPLFFLFVWGFQYVWNVTMPAVFSLREITYWQALGLLAIARVLFGGFGFRWMNGVDKKRFWRERMRLKMHHMSEEEKDEFKKRVREKCGEW